MVLSKSMKVAMLAAVLLLAVAAEFLVLPRFYVGIPVPFPFTAKPVAGVLFVATFFHLLVLFAVILASIKILDSLGYKIPFLPKEKRDWVDVVMFFSFLLSGFGMWYLPIFLIPFIICGSYIAIVELR